MERAQGCMKMKKPHNGESLSKLLVVLVAAVVTGLQIMAAEPSIAFQNPLWTNEVYDASWMKTSDGTYYLVSTEREVLKSRDFVNWQLAAHDFFDRQTLSEINRKWPRIWAPKIMDFDGKGDYRIYVAHNLDDLHSAIYVYRSSRPEGPYRDGRMITYGADTGIEDTIDPDVIRDPETGKWWLFFGSIGGNYRLELSADGLSAAPGAKPVHVAGLKRRDSLRRWCVYEGTSIVRHGDWWYFLAGAGEWWTRNYRIVCGRSRSLTGTFVDRDGHPMTEGYAETVLMTRRDGRFFSPGHPSEMLETDSGRTYMFHFCNSTLDWPKGRNPAQYFRPLVLAEILWTDDGWPYVKDDRIQETGVLEARRPGQK